MCQKEAKNVASEELQREKDCIEKRRIENWRGLSVPRGMSVRLWLLQKKERKESKQTNKNLAMLTLAT